MPSTLGDGPRVAGLGVPGLPGGGRRGGARDGAGGGVGGARAGPARPLHHRGGGRGTGLQLRALQTGEQRAGADCTEHVAV